MIDSELYTVDFRKLKPLRELKTVRIFEIYLAQKERCVPTVYFEFSIVWANKKLKIFFVSYSWQKVEINFPVKRLIEVVIYLPSAPFSINHFTISMCPQPAAEIKTKVSYKNLLSLFGKTRPFVWKFHWILKQKSARKIEKMFWTGAFILCNFCILFAWIRQQ